MSFCDCSVGMSQRLFASSALQRSISVPELAKAKADVDPSPSHHVGLAEECSVPAGIVDRLISKTEDCRYTISSCRHLGQRKAACSAKPSKD